MTAAVVQLMPQDLGPLCDPAAEMALLGEALLDRARVATLRAIGLQVRHFFSQKHQRIWSAIVALDSAGAVPDVVAVRGLLSDRDQLRGCGGAQYLGELLGAPVQPTDQAAHRLMDLARVRDAVEAAQRFIIAARGRDWDGEPQGLLEDVARTMTELAAQRPGKVGDSLRDASADAMRGVIAQTGEALVSTGFGELDRLIGGLRAESIAILAAEKVGKSALTRQIALAVARQGIGTGIISLEMPRTQVALMALAQMGPLDFLRLSRGELSPGEWETAEAVGKWFSQLPLRINAEARDDGRAVSGERIRDIARQWAQEFEAKGQRLGLLVVDLFQCIDTDDPKVEPYPVYRRASRILRDLPQLLGCTVLVVSHVNAQGAPHGYPKLVGDMEGVWRLQRANQPEYAGPSRYVEGTDFELVVERMRVPPREELPFHVPLVGHRASMRFEERE